MDARRRMEMESKRLRTPWASQRNERWNCDTRNRPDAATERSSAIECVLLVERAAKTSIDQS